MKQYRDAPKFTGLIREISVFLCFFLLYLSKFVVLDSLILHFSASMTAFYSGLSGWKQIAYPIYNVIVMCGSDVPYLIALLALTEACPRRCRKWCLYLIDLFLTLIVYADILHIRYFGMYFSLFELKLIPQLARVSRSLLPLVSLFDILLFADIIILPLVIFMFPSHVNRCFAPIHKRRVLLAALTILACVCSIKDIYDGPYSKHSDLYNVQTMGMVAGSCTYHVMDMYYLLSDKLQNSFNLEEIKRKADALKEMEQENNKQLKYLGSNSSKNIIVIQVESLQGFMLGLKYCGHEVTPELNKLAAANIYADNLFSQIIMGGTSDTEFMINTGLYPIVKGTAFNHHADTTYQSSIPRILGQRGYGSYVLHADDKNFWNRDNMYKAIGYTRAYTKDDFKTDEKIEIGLSDESFFHQTLSYIKDLPQPFYASVITLSSHAPFTDAMLAKKVPLLKKEPTKFPYQNADAFLYHYMQAIHYTDKQIGDFVRALSEDGYLKNSIVIIVGDHAAVPSNEMQALYKLLKVKDVGLDCLEEKVPFIMIDGGQKLAVTGRRGHLDIYPTILDACGISGVLSFGRDILNAPEKDHDLLIRSSLTYLLDDVCVNKSGQEAKNIRTGKKEEYSKLAKRIMRLDDASEVSDAITYGAWTEYFDKKAREAKHLGTILP